jgi:hypothetical protein
VRVALTLLGTVPVWIAAQGDAPDLLREARRELVSRHLDSAASLLREVSRDRHAPAPARAEAFVLLGVTRFYEGQDSPPDTLFNCVPRCVGLDSAPAELPRFGSFKILVEANGAMNQYGIVPERAMAVLRLSVDTMGVVERGSVEVVSSTLPREMLEFLVTDSEEARYRPGRVHGRPVRVRIQFEVTMHGPQGR